MKTLAELVSADDPAIALIRDWVAAAPVQCEILSPSSERDATLLGVQVSTRSLLGALAYDTGGILLDHGWLRFLGSGHLRLPRRLDQWNKDRASGFFLVADDAAGGFFALNGGALGDDTGSMYYWGPDVLEWEPLELGLTDLMHGFLTDRLARFYSDLRWQGWQDDVSGLPGDRCYAFYPFLWTKEGSLNGSKRATVPVHEAFDLKADIVRQLKGGA
jgi:hypothetical protein